MDPKQSNEDATTDANTPAAAPSGGETSFADVLAQAIGDPSPPVEPARDESDDPDDDAITDPPAAAPVAEAQDDTPSGDPGPGDKPADPVASEGRNSDEDDDVDPPEPGDADELTPEERKFYSKRAAKRIDQLLTERKDLRAEVEKTKHISTFMEQNDIPSQDVDVILGMAAQLRHGDFAGFLRTVTPYVQFAQEYVGDRLPQDLQQQVRAGYLTEAHARELARTRAQMSWTQSQQQRAEEAARSREQAREQEVRSLHNAVIAGAVNEWERQQRAADPDYEHKADIVRRTSQALILERGAPKTPEEAIQYAEAALEEANRVIGNLRPRLKATEKQPSSVHKPSSPATPEPDNILDVVRMAAGGT